MQSKINFKYSLAVLEYDFSLQDYIQNQIDDFMKNLGLKNNYLYFQDNLPQN
jgi:hypothetical protein